MLGFSPVADTPVGGLRVAAAASYTYVTGAGTSTGSSTASAVGDRVALILSATVSATSTAEGLLEDAITGARPLPSAELISTYLPAPTSGQSRTNVLPSGRIIFSPSSVSASNYAYIFDDIRAEATEVACPYYVCDTLSPTGELVAVGETDLFTSPDGETWTSRGAHGLGTYTGAMVSYVNGTFVAHSGYATTTTCKTSTDGVSWSSTTFAGYYSPSRLFRIAYANGLYFRMFKEYSGSFYHITVEEYLSTGTQVCVTDAPSVDLYAYYAAGNWVLQLGTTTTVFYSDDGNVWNSQYDAAPRIPPFLNTGEHYSTLVTAASAGELGTQYPRHYYSTDCRNWTLKGSFPAPWAGSTLTPATSWAIDPVTGHYIIKLFTYVMLMRVGVFSQANGFLTDVDTGLVGNAVCADAYAEGDLTNDFRAMARVASTAEADLTINPGLWADVGGVSTASATLTSEAAALEATSAAESTATANLKIGVFFAGEAFSESTASAALSIGSGFATTAQAAADAQAWLTTEIHLNSAVVAESTAEASILVSITMSCNAVTESTGTAALSTQVRLATLSESSAICTGTLYTEIRMAAEAISEATLHGKFFIDPYFASTRTSTPRKSARVFTRSQSCTTNL